MGTTQNYHEMLRTVNDDVKYLMREDVSYEVPSHLETFGFGRINGSQILKFSGNEFEITYLPDREEPFMVTLYQESEEVFSKLNKVLENILLEVLENI